MFSSAGRLIQGTINETFLLWREQRKNLYHLSFSFSILVNFAAVVIGFLLTYLADNFYDTQQQMEANGFMELINTFIFGDRRTFMQKFTENTNAVYVFSIAVYSLWLHKSYKTGFQVKPTLKQFFNSFSKKEAKYIVWILLLLIFSGLIFYRDLFGPAYSNDGWLDPDDVYTFEKMFYLTTYLQKVYVLVSTLFPYAAALLLLYLCLRDDLGRKGFSYYKDIFISGIVTCFLIHVLSAYLIQFVSEYVTGLILAILPLRDAIFPAILMFTFMLIVYAVVYLVAASFLYQPFRIKRSQDVSLES